MKNFKHPGILILGLALVVAVLAAHFVPVKVIYTPVDPETFSPPPYSNRFSILRGDSELFNMTTRNNVCGKQVTCNNIKVANRLYLL